MTALRFDCTGAASDPYAAGPTVTFDLKIKDGSGKRVYAIGLRVQIRIEPKRRHYSESEGKKISDLFGEPSRWGQTLNPMQLAELAVMVPPFTGETTVSLKMPITLDTEIASSKYFRGMEEGEIPLLMLFSGTAFYDTDDGVRVAQVPWHEEAEFRLPVKVWKDAIERHFGGQEWILLRSDKVAALAAYRSERAIPSWEETVERLLKEAGAEG